jgi:hypothetical protein
MQFAINLVRSKKSMLNVKYYSIFLSILLFGFSGFSFSAIAQKDANAKVIKELTSETISPQLRGAKIYSNGDVELPNGTFVKKDGTTYFKDGTVQTPNGISTTKDGRKLLPGGIVVHPNGKQEDLCKSDQCKKHRTERFKKSQERQQELFRRGI